MSFVIDPPGDFLHLYDTYGCRLQIGFGPVATSYRHTILYTVSEVRKHGMTIPLITDSQGHKFESLKEMPCISIKTRLPVMTLSIFVRSEDADVIRI